MKRPIEVPGEENNVSGQPVEIGLEITETEGGNSSVTVTVRVNDYAAVGILSASATFNYEDPSSGSTSWEGNATNEISIPLDNNGNDIADGWNPVSHSLDLLLSSADMNVNYDPWADGETGPGTNMYTGDGFTVFEEYRGFYVKGSHTSINPSRKDVFISSQNVEGIGHASGLPYPIVTHEINFNEANMLPDPDGIPFAPDQIPDPWINFNSCGDLLTVVQQNALWIKNMGIDRDGSTLLGVTASAGPVHEVDYIWIFVNTIDRLVDSPY